MEGILNFLADNYLWFLIAAAVLVFALIGFMVDSKRKEKKNAAAFSGETVSNVPNMANTVQNVTPVAPVQEAPVATPEEPVQTAPQVAPNFTGPTVQPSVEAVAQPTMPANNINPQVDVIQPVNPVVENVPQAAPETIVMDSFAGAIPSVNTPSNSVNMTDTFVALEPLTNEAPVQKTVSPVPSFVNNTPVEQLNTTSSDAGVATPIVEITENK